MGQLWFAGTSYADTETLRLLGRSKVDNYSVELDENDWRWLRQHEGLVLGTSVPDYAPFDLSNDGQDLEGITADFAGLLSELLHVPITVRRYDSRSQVIEALKNGEIDLLGTANGFEAADPTLIASTPYAEDQPTLVIRSNDNPESEVLAPDLAGKQVAMLYHYLPADKVRAFYPKANLQLFPSTLSAIGAVAFGQADVYLGDAISTNYLINKNYLNNVQLADFSQMAGSHFAFALRSANTQLKRIVDKALAVIPASERMTIERRWSAGETSIPGNHRLNFTAAEQRWLNEHPRLKVAIVDTFLPFSFSDEKDDFRGIGAELLAKISLRTGLRFQVVRTRSVEELANTVTNGEADLIGAIVPSAGRENVLRFTRPFISNPYVLVSRSETGSPLTLDDMGDKRLAVIPGSTIEENIRHQYPRIRLLPAPDVAETLAMVAKGEADATVNPLISARYIISRQYRDQLRVTSTVGTAPARITLATNRGALELYSILDKALLSIPPEEMDELTSRWRTEVLVDGNFWPRYRSMIIRGSIVLGLVLLLAAGWIAYLRSLIRKRIAAEQALNDQVEFMRVLIDGTPHPIYVRDRDGRMLVCNASYLNVVGLPREAVIGTQVVDGLSGDQAEARGYHDDYLQVMRDGEPRVLDRPLTLPNGKRLTIYHWMLPYRDSKGEVTGMIGGWIDISERQILMEELIEAKGSADDANRAKTTFLATMSHEIRTPMNAVIGMLELATKRADQGVMDRFALDVASGAARGLLDLIGDVLDIARIESGRLSLSPQRANLRELTESVVRIFEGLAQQKQVQLLVDLDLGPNMDVMIDPLRFKQILSNLLSNAIKFTERGRVMLSLSVTAPNADDRVSVRMRVADTGIGISEADQARLFSPFTQASNNKLSARSGSGLGLVICRTLCEMMGGQLQLRSDLGQGTTVDVGFELTTLTPLSTALVTVVEPLSQIGALNILIVDDYPANRILLSQQLNYLGHHVTDAEDGADGLRAWRNDSFDVVITDCNMPTMNGYQLAQAIRDEERARQLQACLVLGFTANAQPEERGRCLEAGMDDCLFKPISITDLSQRLASVEPRSRVQPSTPINLDSLDMDLSSLKQLARGDKSTIQRLVNDLARSTEEDLRRLLRLYTSDDLQGLADLAHRVKGGARIIKAQSLIQQCEQLETACNNADADAVTEAVDAVQQSMEALNESLETLREAGMI
ncbi:transporter substrate-binding domain-containing protein [Pseudomonas sp. Bout1]|uniref:transporter substrate-binding domain-containing protein n=1 Tax=Pseudomonas sp. Bout1 TaxID=3048600 RepID=UPI002AB58AA1|nr:transporter substrate-binding domain-containing protein [Pseudomonas sp. Bout1]MDY7536290.1 transporter substrate-binding domain-containing protein [Pseudomonas sp. Bout1]MEB0183546.1 transporter substrate-binding domain-containing protein [Pseudomonas sp. Bout1]